MVSTPKSPDPVETASAQSDMNRDTAISQQLVNMVNTQNPWGSTNYSQSGNTGYTDSSGNYVSIPQFTQTTTFTPEQQAIFDQSQAAQTNLAGIAESQSAAVSDALSTPFEFNNQDAADWSYDLASSRILPQQQQNEAALRSKLINAGLRPGTKAWDSEMTRLTQANTDQLNQLALTGREQAFGESLATRNQPLNELSALLTGSQVSNPASMSSATPQASVGGVDYAGLVQDNYQSELSNSNAMMGGLFGLLGTGATMLSDERLKTDISRVGTLDNGLPVYVYRYKEGGPRQIGLMAHEVEVLHPDAIHEIGGFKAVDYGMAVL